MMIEVTSKRAGAWGLYVFPPTSVLPAFAQWVHDEATAWATEFLRIMAVARLNNAMVDDGRVDQQRLVLRDAVRALGMLARACDLPIPAFAPWAVPLRKADNGPDPWVNLWGEPPVAGEERPATTTAREVLDQGEGDPRAPFWRTYGGAWRPEVLRLVRGNSSAARDAANVLLELHTRFSLPYDGIAVERSYGGEAPDPTRSAYTGGVETLSRDDNGTACPSAGRSDEWRCVLWSLAEPAAGAAAQDFYLSAVVPMKWQWELLLRVEENLRNLGSVAGVVSVSREYVAALNLATAWASGLRLPEQVVQQVARDQAARFTPTTEEELVDKVGEGALAAGASGALGPATPLALIAGAVILGLRMLQDAIGRPLMYPVDPWGRREPLVQSPFLSGVVEGDHYVAPTITIPAAPRYPSAEEYGLGRGFLGREVFTDESNGGVGGTRAPPAATGEAASGGGGGVVEVFGLGLLLKMLGLF